MMGFVSRTVPMAVGIGFSVDSVRRLACTSIEKV